MRRTWDSLSSTKSWLVQFLVCARHSKGCNIWPLLFLSLVRTGQRLTWNAAQQAQPSNTRQAERLLSLGQRHLNPHVRPSPSSASVSYFQECKNVCGESLSWQPSNLEVLSIKHLFGQYFRYHMIPIRFAPIQDLQYWSKTGGINPAESFVQNIRCRHVTPTLDLIMKVRQPALCSRVLDMLHQNVGSQNQHCTFRG